jgi:hypothetical protein
MPFIDAVLLQKLTDWGEFSALVRPVKLVGKIKHPVPHPDKIGVFTLHTAQMVGELGGYAPVYFPPQAPAFKWEAGKIKVSAVKVRVAKVSGVKVRVAKVSVVKVSAVKIRAAKVSAVKVSAVKVSAVKVSVVKVSAVKVRIAKVSAAKVGPGSPGTAQP